MLLVKDKSIYIQNLQTPNHASSQSSESQSLAITMEAIFEMFACVAPDLLADQ
jgi:hypothetical protein